MAHTTRRTFLKAASSTAVVAATTAASSSRAAESDAIPVGVIGPGGMGMSHVRQLSQNKEVRIAWVCDVDETRLNAAADHVAKETGTRPQTTKDLRKILDDASVQAVWIATPDHWHAPATILACDAGKHVYVEKPCSHNLREGRLMIEASGRNNRAVQVGTQSRSTEGIQKGIQRLRDGVIGEILVAKAWNSQRRGTIGHQETAAPPPTLDFDLWLGAAPVVPYRPNLLPGVWRWWYDFGTGDMGNDGVHDIDIARWGLGVETLPSRIAALGGKYFFDDDQQFPDTQSVLFEYTNQPGPHSRKQLIFEQRIWSPYVQENYENGCAWYGTEGMMILGKTGGYQIFGRRNKLIEESKWGGPDLAAHHRNFLDSVRAGNFDATKSPKLNADISINFHSSALSHLGNIATRVGRVLNLDPASDRITGDDEADALLTRTYRDHWAKPKGV
jgi:predicted dehydrogenase